MENLNEIYKDENQLGIDSLKCDRCQGTLKYNEVEGVLECEHCGTKTPFEKVKSDEQAFEELFKINTTWSKETKSYQCPNCKAKTIVNERDLAGDCPFCGTPLAIDLNEIVGQKPNAVVPFSIDEAIAEKNLTLWASKKFWAPKYYKQSFSAQGIKGVYIPAFTFDANTFSVYNGRLGKRYVETKRGSDGRTYTVTKIRYFNVSGSIQKLFDDVLVQSSSFVQSKVVSKLEPFPTNDAKVYDHKFLMGKVATQYIKDGKACWYEAEQRINNSIKQAILSRYSYDVVDYLNLNVKYNHRSYKYVLIPLWTAFSNYLRKTYNVFVNGSTGKVYGKYPISPVKVTIAIILGLILAVALGILINYFGGDIF